MNITENFSTEFKAKLKELGIRKMAVVKHLDMTLPTLNSKLANPSKFTVSDLEKLRELNINIKP